MTTGMDEAENRAKSRIGTTIDGKWRLDSLLGIGGMAAVYAGTHRNGTRGAIKILNPEIALSTNAKTRFLREGYVANKIGHPGVVLILDDDEAPDGTAYLVMELLDGDTLQSLIAEQRVPPLGEVLRIARDVLDVLEVAHQKEIVHRDLKPGNLLLTRDEHAVKLLDFGVAKVREASFEGIPNVTTLAAIGTPGFMPPEQARGRWDSVDGRADIWALGATMFALLTGQYVHDEETANEQLLAAMTKPARELRDVMPDAPESVAAIVDRALAFDREERFRDAAEMRVAVVKAMTDLGMDGATASPTKRTSLSLSSRVRLQAGEPMDVAALGAAATMLEPTTADAAVSDVDTTRGPSSKASVPPRGNRFWMGLAAGAVVVAVLIRLFGFRAASPRDDGAATSTGPSAPNALALEPPIPTPSASAASAIVEAPPPEAPSPSPLSSAQRPPAPQAPQAPRTASSTPAAAPARSVAHPRSPSSVAVPTPAVPLAPPTSSVDIFGRRH